MRRRHFIEANIVAASTFLAKPIFGAESAKVEVGSPWPCWRGPSRDGYCLGSSLPDSLTGVDKRWSRDLADSYSGPIVTGGKVFTTETVDEKNETLLALSCQNGDLVWRQEWAGAMDVPFFAARNGDWIRSTPATDGQRIVLGGMRDVVACFDVVTGQELWRIDFVEQHGATLPSFGLVCSPLIHGNHVYIQAGGGVRQIRLSDGALGWSTLEDQGGMYGGAFSSPSIATIDGKQQLLTQTRTTLAGVDIDSGEVLWKQAIESFRGMNILTPVVWKDRVFTSSYGGKSQLYSVASASGSPELIWEGKAEAYMSSPVVIDDHLYLHLKNNRFCCIELASGEEKWRTTPFGQYWSMVTDGTKILALDQTGELLLVAAKPDEFTLLDRRQVCDEPSWAHVAVADKNIYIRRQHGLDAFSWQ